MSRDPWTDPSFCRRYDQWRLASPPNWEEPDEEERRDKQDLLDDEADRKYHAWKEGDWPAD